MQLVLTLPATAGFVDEGVVISLDGKGMFEVKTERSGTIVFHSSPKLLDDKSPEKTKRWPHSYKEIKAGDYVSVDWARDKATGRCIAYRVGIKKRGG